jgi:hypothetical protein
MRFIRTIARTAAVALLVTAASCSQKKQSDEAEVSADVRRKIEAAARDVVNKEEDWVERAEFRIYQEGDGWRVTAWRVEHPEATGNKRYVPWGARTMTLDRNFRVLEYRSGAK